MPYKLPPRPGHGTRGRPISLWTNFFKVDIPPDLTLYHYDVVIIPDVPRAIKRRVMQTAVQNYKEVFSGQFPVFDGEKGLYCHKKFKSSQACNYLHMYTVYTHCLCIIVAWLHTFPLSLTSTGCN